MKSFSKVVGSMIELPDSQPQKVDCDVLEVRLDAPFEEQNLLNFLSHCPITERLFTVRDPKEGGIRAFTPAEAQEKLTPFLESASYIDIELLNATQYTTFISEIKAKQCKLVLSYHDFKKTPTLKEMELLLVQALEKGAEIIKFAFMMHSIQDIARCQTLLMNHPDHSLSVMGMGDYGPSSRLLLAQSGSLLNYGYLGSRPTAPGQWSSKLLKTAIEHSVPLQQ